MEDFRLGKMCKVPSMSRLKVNIYKMRASSFQVTGPVLFNGLPKELRNLTKWGMEFD